MIMKVSIQNCADFLNQFLTSKELSSPDGRPLYAYKISDGQYNALKSLLINHWDNSNECYACFVLFSVEFLRAEFDEGHLNWESIFSTLNKGDYNNHNKRSTIVKNGLDYWGRSIYTTGYATEYIESLRFESGLPATCLTQQNQVARLITKSFQFLESFMVNEVNLINMIQASPLIQYLPGVLQQDTFFELVAKICIRFRELKERFNLSNEDHPIDRLNTRHPKWKDDIPLKISGQRMEQFFDNLISEISTVEKLDRQIIQIEHELVELNDQFSIKSRIQVPKGNYSPSAFSIDDVNQFEKLPGHFMMLFESGDLLVPLAYFSKTVDGRISSNGISIELPIKVYGKDWKIGFSSNKQSVELYSGISQSFQLPSHEPLLFILNDSVKWIFKGSGNQKVRKASGRVLTPDTIHFTDSTHPRYIAKTETDLSIFELDITSRFKDDDTLFEYTIAFNQESDTNHSIHLIPNDFGVSSHHILQFLNPDLFFGIPRIYLFNTIFGIHEKFNGELQFLIDKNSWETRDGIDQYGMNKLRFVDKNHEVLGYRSITVLPEDFEVKISDRENQIVIISREKFSILPERNEVKCDINEEEESVTINFWSDIVNDNPYINFLLMFDNGNNVKIKLPNPAVHEVFINSEEEIINRTEMIVDKMHGNAIVINNFSGQNITKQYRLKLVDQHNIDNPDIELIRKIGVPAYGTLRFPLFHWASEINTLLTLAQSVDASVRISSSQPHHFIDAKRFEYFPTISEGQLCIDQPFNPSEIQVKTFRLDHEFSSESVFNIPFDETLTSWYLEDALPSSGFWFIYSSKESDRMIRPKVFIHQLENYNETIHSPIGQIHETCLMSFQERQDKLIELFDSKHNSFDDSLWQELFNLYTETRHLPFDTLDVWKALIKSEKGMLTFLLSNWGDNELIVNLAQEFSFNWQLVPISLWTETLQAWCFANHQDSYFQYTLGLKTEFIKSELGFNLITDILQGTKANRTEFEFIRALKSLINGDGNNGLRVRHTDGTGKWPTMASDYIKEKYKQLSDNYRSIIPGQFWDWQKPVIYLPVIMAYQSVYGSFINHTELDARTKLGLWLTADFDQGYFKSAFDLCQSLFYSKKQTA